MVLELLLAALAAGNGVAAVRAWLRSRRLEEEKRRLELDNRELRDRVAKLAEQLDWYKAEVARLEDENSKLHEVIAKLKFEHNDVTSVDKLDIEIARLYLSGMHYTEIAKIVDKHPSTVWRRLKKLGLIGGEPKPKKAVAVVED